MGIRARALAQDFVWKTSGIESIMKISRNLHTIDRVARIIVGMGCIYIGFIDTVMIYSDIISGIVGLFGVVNVGVAVFSHCPVYKLAGISTYSSSDE
jgi:hypothetical protein